MRRLHPILGPCVRRSSWLPNKLFVLAVTCALADAAPGIAGQAQAPAEPVARAWRWDVDANVIVGYNGQVRKFRDFHQFESQNWVMAGAERPVGEGVIRGSSMWSFEPFTLRNLGSAQVFQTGETFDQIPLTDYQHPHDLIMALGASYRRPVGRRVAVALDAAVVGSPALGPTPFMHRPSAAGNPQVPLAHHNMDATHITPGAATVGVESGGMMFEASAFRGREPDEDRLDLDLGRLDSWSARASWRRGSWSAQLSGGHLKQPEFFDPYDVTRLTASVAYSGLLAARPLAAMVAWGRNRDIDGRHDAYLAEGVWKATERTDLYSRAELVVKNILTAGGRHPPGFRHPHVFSRVGAITIGVLHERWRFSYGRMAVGGDITGYHVAANLRESYGRPVSIHVFLRYRPPAKPGGGHVH